VPPAAPSSRPRTFAPGTAALSRSSCGPINAPPRRRADATRTSCSATSPGASATRWRCAASPYVHPRVLEALASVSGADALAALKPVRRSGLSAAERRLLSFLSRGE
jgi:hypothetical protein